MQVQGVKGKISGSGLLENSLSPLFCGQKSVEKRPTNSIKGEGSHKAPTEPPDPAERTGLRRIILESYQNTERTCERGWLLLHRHEAHSTRKSALRTPPCSQCWSYWKQREAPGYRLRLLTLLQRSHDNTSFPSTVYNHNKTYHHTCISDLLMYINNVKTLRTSQ